MEHLDPLHSERPVAAPANVDPLSPDLGEAGSRCLRPQPAAPATGGGTALAVETRGVRKSFGEHLVLDGINLEVMAGTVFALLGPNGSGKTTAVRILSTLLAADAGLVRVAGHDVASNPEGVRAAIGVTGQFSAVDKLLTGTENLQLMADLAHLSRAAGRRRAAELLDRFDLLEVADKTAATYSGGMRRRLDLAMTLVGDPRIVFLDEPTTGLDPRGRHAVWQLVRSLVADDGVTIFLTTQYLDEADQLAGRLAVLDHGAVVAEGTPDQLKGRIPGGQIRLQFSDPKHLDSAARLLPTGRRDDETLSLQIPSDGTVPAVRSVLVELDEHMIDVESFSIHTPDLDDVFFAVTGHPTTGHSIESQESRR
ncbi:MAG: ATP-binding cassette domain-containing protein [Nocardioidaceae bacterium]